MNRPSWFAPLSRALTVCGMLALVAGVALYGRRALSGEGSMVVVFLLIMAALGFFNSTTVIAKRLDRRAPSDADRDTSTHL